MKKKCSKCDQILEKENHHFVIEHDKIKKYFCNDKCLNKYIKDKPKYFNILKDWPM